MLTSCLFLASFDETIKAELFDFLEVLKKPIREDD